MLSVGGLDLFASCRTVFLTDYELSVFVFVATWKRPSNNDESSCHPSFNMPAPETMSQVQYSILRYRIRRVQSYWIPIQH